MDRWLWAARIFKTRQLAAEAASGGRVDVNGARGKPGKTVKVGDRLDVTNGPVRMVLVITKLAEKRVSAALAAELYEETEESRERRAAYRAEQRLAAIAQPVHGKGRPTKRDRRRYDADRDKRRRDSAEQPDA